MYMLAIEFRLAIHSRKFLIDFFIRYPAVSSPTRDESADFFRTLGAKLWDLTALLPPIQFMGGKDM
jgi:hypothetical protein